MSIREIFVVTSCLCNLVTGIGDGINGLGDEKTEEDIGLYPIIMPKVFPARYKLSYFFTDIQEISHFPNKNAGTRFTSAQWSMSASSTPPSGSGGSIRY